MSGDHSHPPSQSSSPAGGRLVYCVKLQTELPGLATPPWPLASVTVGVAVRLANRHHRLGRYVGDVSAVAYGVPALQAARVATVVPARAFVTNCADVAPITGPVTTTATTAAEAVDLAWQIGFPVALKIAAPDIVHKSEAGGVRLNLQDPDGVRRAFDEVLAAKMSTFVRIAPATTTSSRSARACISGDSGTL